MLTVQNNSSLQRYEIYEAGERIGFVQYEMHDEEMWILFTQLRRKFKSVARVNKVLGHVLKDAWQSQIHMLPFCPAFRVFMAQNPTYSFLVPEPWHERISRALPKDREDLGQSVLKFIRFTGSPWRKSTNVPAGLLVS